MAKPKEDDYQKRDRVMAMGDALDAPERIGWFMLRVRGAIKHKDGRDYLLRLMQKKITKSEQPATDLYQAALKFINSIKA